MSVERKDDTFEIHQRRQIEDIVEEFGEDTNMKKVDSPIEKGPNLPINTTTADHPKLRYRALVGALLWIARCTRPDFLCAITYLSRCPRIHHARCATVPYLTTSSKYTSNNALERMSLTRQHPPHLR